MKKLTLILSFTVIAGMAKAQTFMHGVGTGLLVATRESADNNAFGTLMYNPRFSFAETDISSFSVGIPLTFGVAGSYNYSSNIGSTSDFRYMINAPLIFNYNRGAGSSKENDQRFGWFLGAGVGLNHGNYFFYNDYYGETYSDSETSFGPACNGGVRFAVGQGTHNIEILASFMKGLNEGKPNLFGLQGVFNF